MGYELCTRPCEDQSLTKKPRRFAFRNISILIEKDFTQKHMLLCDRQQLDWQEEADD